ncbi:ABC transporter transmembrane domain-containing protein, partial [Clostridium perfringens]
MLKYSSKYILKYKLSFITLIIFSILDAILLALTPYISSKLIDSLVNIPSKKVIYSFVIIYFGIAMFQLLSQYVQIVNQTRLIANASMELNKDMIKHMQKLPLEFFSDKDLAYYNQRIYSDSSAVISFSVNTVLQLITNIIATSLTLYIVVKTNSYICLLFFIA